ERALAADARDVVVLRALRRHAMLNEDWAAATDALEKEAGLGLSVTERGSALKLLARIQLSKLRDPAAAEQAASHAATLQEGDYVARVLAASARLARGDAARAAEALMDAAACWPDADAKAAMLLHAAQLMESAGKLEAAKGAFDRVLELQPGLLAARLGVIRAARGLGDDEAALESLRAIAEHVSPPVAAAVRRTLLEQPEDKSDRSAGERLQPNARSSDGECRTACTSLRGAGRSRRLRACVAGRAARAEVGRLRAGLEALGRGGRRGRQRGPTIARDHDGRDDKRFVERDSRRRRRT
ncbi:MAG: hypothetical protein JRF55_13220, partial [Deltaproteobacteria bacterium]|nr:hypothetical protein [Deltaproteobacteria bacterium]